VVTGFAFMYLFSSFVINLMCKQLLSFWINFFSFVINLMFKQLGVLGQLINGLYYIFHDLLLGTLHFLDNWASFHLF
jgi:hypothetical protein